MGRERETEKTCLPIFRLHTITQDTKLLHLPSLSQYWLRIIKKSVFEKNCDEEKKKNENINEEIIPFPLFLGLSMKPAPRRLCISRECLRVRVSQGGGAESHLSWVQAIRWYTLCRALFITIELSQPASNYHQAEAILNKSRDKTLVLTPPRPTHGHSAAQNPPFHKAAQPLGISRLWPQQRSANWAYPSSHLPTGRWHWKGQRSSGPGMEPALSQLMIHTQRNSLYTLCNRMEISHDYTLFVFLILYS